MRKNRTLPAFGGEWTILAVLIFLVALFFSNDFGLIDIQKTAIILSAGIDKAEDQFEITAQVAVPQSSNTGAQFSPVPVSGKGETVAQAFREINATTGWYPKLIFCDVIVLSEEVAKEDVFDCLGYFLRDEYMSDNCLLTVCQGKAKDVLSAKTAADDASALALDKVLASEAKKSGTVASVNLKDFSAGYYGEAKSGFMPYLTLRPADTPTAGGEENSPSQEGGDVLKADRTAVFYAGKCVDVLTPAESFALNLTTGSVRQAVVEARGQRGTNALVLSSLRTGIQTEGDVPKVKVRLSAVARTADRNTAASLSETAQPNQVDAVALKNAEKDLRENLLSAFEKCKAGGCDVFSCLNRLKKFDYENYRKHRDGLLPRLTAEITVELQDAY